MRYQRLRTAGFASAVATAMVASAVVAMNPADASQVPVPPGPLAASPEAVCGSGFAIVDSANVYGKQQPKSTLTRPVLGTTFLLWNGATGKNCVMTIRRAKSPARVPMTATLQVKGKKEVHQDKGDFTMYAGPVRAPAAGICVKWGGTIGDAKSVDDDTTKDGYEHCGGEKPKDPKPPNGDPQPTGQFRSPFTCGKSVQYNTRRNHGKSPSNSVDFQIPEGTDILASDGGTVSKVRKWNYSFGYHVEINHGNGWKTRYAHLSNITVKENATVKKGQKIGDSGNTGNSDGAHMHYEQIKNGVTQPTKVDGGTLTYYATTTYKTC